MGATAAPDEPVGPAEFAGLMAMLGPFSPGRESVVAVSGGADSMALAYLASSWGQVRAAIVDHGLRPGAAAEAALTAERLARFGVAASILSAGLAPGPAASERARDARYRLLFQFCREIGRPDLLVAHHRTDQAETVRMRADSGSQAAGLAGMPAIAHRDEARLLRPLLAIPPSRLRATLRAAGIEWVEDPTNHDQRTRRAQLRAAMDGASIEHALNIARTNGEGRTANERQLAGELASVHFHPAGFAVLPAAMSDDGLSAVIWAISGQRYPPPRSALFQGLSKRSIHNVLLHPVRGTMIVTREPAAVAAPAPAAPGIVWDARFRVAAVPPGLTIGALGSDAARVGRRSQLPSVVRRALPAFRRGDEIVAVPHLGFPDLASCRSVSILFNPLRPAGAAPFINPYAVEGV